MVTSADLSLALKDAAERLGPASAETIRLAVLCSVSHCSDGNLEAAVALSQRQLEVATLPGAPCPESVVPLMTELARVYSICGRHREALALLRRERCLFPDGEGGPAQVHRACQIAEAHSKLLEHGDAVEEAQAAVAYAEANLDDTDDATISALFVLSEALHNSGQPLEVLPLLARAHLSVQRARKPHPRADEIVLAMQREVKYAEQNRHVVRGTKSRVGSLSLRTLGDNGKPNNEPGGGTVGTADEQPPLSLASGPLPDGWLVNYTPSGKCFFANIRLRTTTWVDPRLRSDDDTLPAGWEEAYDGSGEIYYINHNQRTTQREHPLAVLCGKSPSGESQEGDLDTRPPSPAGSQASTRSWGSISSLMSSVSDLTRTISGASLSSLMGARDMLSGAVMSPRPTLDTSPCRRRRPSEPSKLAMLWGRQDETMEDAGGEDGLRNAERVVEL